MPPEHPHFDPSDPDFRSRVRTSFDGQAMMRTLGIELVDLGPGWVELGFDHDDAFTRQHGYTHAGAIATALDSACGYAALTLMPADSAVLTVEYKINLLRPAKAVRYRATATVVKSGRTLTVCNALATPADSADAIAVMTGTLMALVDAGIRD